MDIIIKLSWHNNCLIFPQVKGALIICYKNYFLREEHPSAIETIHPLSAGIHPGITGVAAAGGRGGRGGRAGGGARRHP